MEPIKWTNVWNKTTAFFFEHFPDCLIAHLGMFVCLGVGDTAIFKPCIELGVGLELRARYKEPSPDHTNLVLDLAFLPARRWRAGDRINKIMSAHLLETSIVGSVFADEDRIDGGLHIVIDTPRTGTAKESERLVMRIEDHLLDLPWISPHKWHPAVAQANMCGLHGRRDTVDQNNLMAPIELIGLARIKAQRNIS